MPTEREQTPALNRVSHYLKGKKNGVSLTMSVSGEVTVIAIDLPDIVLIGDDAIGKMGLAIAQAMEALNGKAAETYNNMIQKGEK